ncbi:putative nucleic acid-binding protein [Halopolyspora algeriensis]|uniref:Ribonuclease VapC n=1 Tax=Halopolyspora algeriensis TaxID=1500506 RepID=A0A368VTF9_9ACTN|nr:type II toxin-antitoxin system VapC family toxin [Halopolyspora algeriensis]RCW45101.1 putative nucleic acid-binding protein [Halopolyspora algeriensis]TQM53177.1 putative nucleic acid-binding protein [Halopolyspora algeriensis]
MLVVDASVLADALLDDGPAGRQCRDELAADDRWAAPSHLTVEILSVVRGRLLGRKITRERADEAVLALGELAVELVESGQLITRVWQLRGNATAYDATYVAAAEAMECPLVTRDRRLSRARGIRCEVRLVKGE